MAMAARNLKVWKIRELAGVQIPTLRSARLRYPPVMIESIGSAEIATDSLVGWSAQSQRNRVFFHSAPTLVPP
jgi:hypothetical protein